jgi:predicted NAD/FAD-binding protein
VHDRHKFSHPVFNCAAVTAQSRLTDIQGKNRSHFCGAWTRYGFHEDGLMSGVAVAKDLGASWI